MTEYKWFRDEGTGKVGKYPARFASLLSLTEVDEDDAGCLDCAVKLDPSIDAAQNDPLFEPDPEPVAAAEPAPKKVSTTKAKDIK